MKRRLFSVFAVAVMLASCSTAYRQGQTPDDVYFSPGKEKERTYASAENNRREDNYSRRNNNSNYDDYTSSSDDQYLRMKIQNRYRWNALDDYDYWYSPGYALNNYYGYNNFNPLMYNSWGLSLYSSPFAVIQPYGWFNSYYPTYGYYTPYSGYYGHSYGYGYTPVFLGTAKRTPGVHRPLLGGYVNNGNGYSNSNNRSRSTGRYIPAFGSGDNSRYSNTNSNRNNNSFNNNNSSFNRPSSGSSSTPVRSFTPSSSGSSSSGGGGGVTRQPRR